MPAKEASKCARGTAKPKRSGKGARRKQTLATNEAGTGGGGSAISEGATTLLGCDGENFSALDSVPADGLTLEAINKIVSSYEPAGTLTEEGKRQRIQLVKRCFESTRRRMFPKKPPPPALLSELDQVSLSWVASRCVDGFFQLRLEEVILNLIREGHLFRSFRSPRQAIVTIINRLITLASKAGAKQGALQKLLDPSAEAQRELASVAAVFVTNIKKSDVAPWLVAESKEPHFAEEWSRIYRLKTPHNRIQFAFAFDCLAKLDATMCELCAGPLVDREWDFPPPRSDAAEQLATITSLHPALSKSINAALNDIESAQVVSVHALGLPWASGWRELRDDHPRFKPIVEPFFKAEWTLWKHNANPEDLDGSRIAKLPWKQAWRTLGNCVETLVAEWPFPPIKPEAKPRLVDKHTGRH